MVAVSVGESESLKIQDPFKQYVKLSRLKIYVPCVHEGEGFSFCSLCAPMKAANVWSQDERKANTQDKMQLHIQVRIWHAHDTQNIKGDVSEIGFLQWWNSCKFNQE